MSVQPPAGCHPGQQTVHETTNADITSQSCTQRFKPRESRKSHTRSPRYCSATSLATECSSLFAVRHVYHCDMQGLIMRGSLVHAEHRFEFPVLLTRDPDLKTVLLACVAPPLLCYSLNRFVVRPLWRRHRLQKVSLRHWHWHWHWQQQWHANFAHPFCCMDSIEGCGSLMRVNRTWNCRDLVPTADLSTSQHASVSILMLL